MNQLCLTLEPAEGHHPGAPVFPGTELLPLVFLAPGDVMGSLCSGTRDASLFLVWSPEFIHDSELLLKSLPGPRLTRMRGAPLWNTR